MATASDFAFIIGDDEEEISARTAQGGQGDENRRFNFNLDHPIAEDGGVLFFLASANTVAGGPDSYFLRGAVCQYRKTV